MMAGLVKVAMLVGLLKRLVETDNPLLCAGIYGAAGFPFSPMVGTPFGVALIGSLVGFVLAFAWFWLLVRVETGSGLWWTILVVGLLIGVV